MNLKRLFGLALAVLMVLAIIPTASIAAGIDYQLTEAEGMKRWDDVWAVLDPVEEEMMARGATRAEVTYAVYQAALNCPLIDKGSITDLSDNEFTFTTDGMLGGYNYRVRNYTKAPARLTSSYSAVPHKVGTRGSGSAGAMDILLVQPYMGFDSSFTQQYNEEGASLAATTGGTLTTLQGNNATGPAIAAAYANKGIVIYDSHGNCIDSKQTSYLDLHTNSGLTTTDYNNGWAYNGGSFYGIDGRYIQNHAAPLSNPLVWMAICEGMKIGGRGTTGTALLAAGAGCVYGYSQSVTFAGDYEYEATFFNELKEGYNVAESLEVMKEVHGIPDPYGDAYPIVMSESDPFPTNPDGPQNVNCDWTIFSQEPVALESWSLSEEAVNVYKTFTKTVNFEKIPENANQYELEWHSENTSVATVAGNNRKVTITGVNVGSTRVYANVKVDGATIGTAYCDVTVLGVPTLNDAANAEGGTLNFTNPNSSYPWTVGVVDGEPVAKSGNVNVNNSTSTMQLVLSMQAGERLTFKMKASSEDDYDFLKFFVNNTQYGSNLSGETDWVEVTYTAASAGTYTFQWRFIKDPYVGSHDDCGYVKEVRYIQNYIMGDADNNGIVDANDALVVMRHSMSLITLTGNQLLAADVNGDGSVDASDALELMRISMNLV